MFGIKTVRITEVCSIIVNSRIEVIVRSLSSDLKVLFELGKFVLSEFKLDTVDCSFLAMNTFHVSLR